MDRRRFLETTALTGLAVASGTGRAAPQVDSPMMPFIMFSKKLKGQSIDEMIESLKFVGADGFDLAVRPGYPVKPENVGEALAPAAEKIRAAGLVVPMVTAPTDLTKASAPYAEPMFSACGEAGIPLIKLGYWKAPMDDYWEAVDRMKADVAGFAQLGERFGVKPCLHTHSGANLALNAAASMHILRDFAPQQVGAYIDVGHLAVCGEPPPLAFAMAAEWLSIVGVKDLDRVKNDDGATRARTVPIGEGFVDWPAAITWLVRHNFSGPLTFHSEFPSPSIEHLLEQTKKDIVLLRDLERKAREAAGS